MEQLKRPSLVIFHWFSVEWSQWRQPRGEKQCCHNVFRRQRCQMRMFSGGNDAMWECFQEATLPDENVFRRGLSPQGVAPPPSQPFLISPQIFISCGGKLWIQILKSEAILITAMIGKGMPCMMRWVQVTVAFVQTANCPKWFRTRSHTVVSQINHMVKQSINCSNIHCHSFKMT